MRYMSMEKQEGHSPRKRGRPAGKDRNTYSVVLDEDTAEWAKKQEGGLSGTVRRALREEYNEWREQTGKVLENKAEGKNAD